MKRLELEIESCVSCPYCEAVNSSKGVWWCDSLELSLDDAGIYGHVHPSCPLPDKDLENVDQNETE